MLWQISKGIDRLTTVTGVGISNILAIVNTKVTNQLGVPSMRADTLANLPVPGETGRMFVATDTYAFYRDNGLGWDLIGGPGIGTVTGSGAATQVAFWNGTSVISGNANLYWDNVNTRLGIGVAAPTKTIDGLGEFLLTGTNTAANTNSLLLAGSFKIEDPYVRSNLAVGTAMGNNIDSHYWFKYDTDGVTKEMSLGSSFISSYSHSGPVGATVWGFNTFYPQRRAADFRSTMKFPAGTYTMLANKNYVNAATQVALNVGSSDNTGPLTIGVGSDPSSGLNGMYVRYDTWPDAGTVVKTYTGWHNLYSAFYDSRGGAGSTTQRVNFYAAGHNAASGSQVITDMMGFYSHPMKSANVTNAWGFYQNGASDKNYFAGNTLIGTTTDAGYKLDVDGSFISRGTANVGGSSSSVTLRGTNAQAGYGITLNGDVWITSSLDVLSRVSAGGSTHSSAIMSATSTTQGFLPPRMTSAQRTAIVSPAVGLMVYQTDGTEGVYVNTSTGWKSLTMV